MRSLCSLAFLAACTFSSPKLEVDAAPGDGSGSGGVWTVVEELTVPASGIPVTSAFVLQAGVGYRLRASGTFYIATSRMADAEYWAFNVGPPMDGAVNIDIGLAVDDPILDEARTPRWGRYDRGHTYEVSWDGKGAPIVAQFHDGNYVDNELAGKLTLAILELR